MKEVINVDTLATPPQGKMIVKIDDTYDERVSAGGVILPNAAHDEAEADGEGFNLSEWIIRHGTVVKMPRFLSNEDYDWETADEIQVGDQVYWPIVRFFDYPVLRFEKQLFLIVDYFDILLRIREEEIRPVNGFYVFKQHPIIREWGAYRKEVYNPWFRLEMMGDEVVYKNAEFNYPPEWKPGMDCLIFVPPIKLEADTNKSLDEDFYMAQKRHILMACWPNSNASEE